MDADSQGGADETDALADARELFGKKWFWPILEELWRFQNAIAHLFPGGAEVLSDDAPYWAVMAAWDIGQEMADYNGIAFPPDITSRHVGKMIGAQLGMYTAYERAYSVFCGLRPDEIQKFDKAWKQDGFCGECKIFAREFAEKWTPLFHDIWRKAVKFSADAGFFEHAEYCLGFAQGSKMVEEVVKRLRNPPKLKRGKDAEVRNCVRLFAMCFGQLIEKEKAGLSWPELHQMFLLFTDYKIEIEEDTFKKILSRRKEYPLKGVGQAGRKVPDDLGTPKSLRRP